MVVFMVPYIMRIPEAAEWLLTTDRRTIPLVALLDIWARSSSDVIKFRRVSGKQVCAHRRLIPEGRQ
jgi:hypothetical protein